MPDSAGSMNILLVMSRVCRRLAGEAGATMVEYGLVVALVATIAAGSAAVLGNGLGDVFSSAAGVISGQGGQEPANPPAPEQNGGGGGGGGGSNGANNQGQGGGRGGGVGGGRGSNG